mmetsp:Transcript_101974/g.271362  ORF Transcript_101974/g.271362 Transcript_101974/m.271362 type:complete len:204 (-) Transcript_101974:379-990(-)
MPVAQTVCLQVLSAGLTPGERMGATQPALTMTSTAGASATDSYPDLMKWRSLPKWACTTTSNSTPTPRPPAARASTTSTTTIGRPSIGGTPGATATASERSRAVRRTCVRTRLSPPPCTRSSRSTLTAKRLGFGTSFRRTRRCWRTAMRPRTSLPDQTGGPAWPARTGCSSCAGGPTGSPRGSTSRATTTRGCCSTTSTASFS